MRRSQAEVLQVPKLPIVAPLPSFRILISLEEITSAVGILFEKQKAENLREDEAGND